MINVELCKSSSPRNAINKSVEVIAEVECIFKNGADILNPVLLLKIDHVPTFNYVKIPEFKRHYFVGNIKNVDGKLWEINCSVDVLSSFKDQILTNTVIVDRQENSWNLFLNDDSFRAYQNPYIIQKEFPVGFNPSTGGFVLLVAGSAPTS